MLRRIRTIFLKNGHVTDNTVLGDSGAPFIVDVRQDLNIDETDTLILVSKVSGTQVTAITCTKLLWRDEEQVGSIDLHSIKGVDVNLAEMKLRGMMLHTADRLNITLDNGSIVRVPVEPGGALSGLWNALIAVAHDNARWRSLDGPVT